MGYKTNVQDFPGGPGVKNYLAMQGDTVVQLWAQEDSTCTEQLSPHKTTDDAGTTWSPMPATGEATEITSSCPTTREEAPLATTRKAQVQQQRPSNSQKQNKSFLKSMYRNV